MLWKILGWVLICSALGNIFGTGNILVGIIAIVLAVLCFRKANAKQASTAQNVTYPSVDNPQYMPPVNQPAQQSSMPTYTQAPSFSSYTSASAVSTPSVSSKSIPVDQKFAEILAERFSEYTVKRNVDFASMTSEWWVCSCGAENIGSFCAECGRTKSVDTEWTCKCGCRNHSKFCSECGKAKPAPLQYEPIDFLLMRDGMPKLAILLVTRRRWNHKPIRNTIEACEEAGIPWQRYFEEYDNEGSYVTDRILRDLR